MKWRSGMVTTLPTFINAIRRQASSPVPLNFAQKKCFTFCRDRYLASSIVERGGAGGRKPHAVAGHLPLS